MTTKKLAEGADREHCVSVRGGKVHEVTEWDDQGPDYVFPLCRTGSMTNSGTKYTRTTQDLTCTHCVANRERRRARQAEEAAAAAETVEETPAEAPAEEAPAEAVEEAPAAELDEWAARARMAGTWSAADEFHAERTADGQLTGFTFGVGLPHNRRYGWIAADGTYTEALVRTRREAADALTSAPAAAVEEPARYTVECAIVQAHPGYREDRIGVRIAGEEDARQLIALPRTADWSTLSVLRAFGWEAEQLEYVASLNLVRGTVRIIEPETCEAAQEIQQAVRREITARLTVRLSSGAAAHFQPVTADSGPYPIGWTYRIGYGERAFFGAVTAGGTLVAPAGIRTREDAEEELRTADPAAAPYNEALHAYVSGLPAEELGRHFLAARNGSLNTLPDTLTAGAPITVQQARDLVTRTYPSAEEFEAFQGQGGRFLGWTFRSGRLHSSRYGWITGRGTLTPALEPYRSEAGNVLVHADRDDQEAAERAKVARSMTGRKLAENRCVHNRYTRADVQGDPVLACTMKAGGDTFAVFTDEGAAEVFDCAVEAANEAARMGGWDEYEGADPLPFWAKTCPEHAEEVAGRCELCGQDTPEEDAEEEPEAADSPEADATVTALPFHGPEGYTGPRAVCSYDDHTAPAREDGTVDTHERTAGVMGSCPGSLLTARESSDQPTRWFTAALSYEHPREAWLVTGAKPGDVVRYDLEEMTVEDLQVDEDDPSTVYLHLDWVSGPVRFTVGERLRFTRRVRRQDARCQECGVYAVLESDTATDGPIRARICGFCDLTLTPEDAAREAATRMHPSAHEFRPFHRAGEEQPAGWTFRVGYAAHARYAVVTAAAELPPGLYEYATTAERAFLQAEQEAAAVQL
ncbi:hypothetical protein GR925_25960 [Streptomyces sp. HUCO-GS316]|uniref:hypothetical protein n=1 Tax=Streptomyces sp. HUCO-GS316 TaxID=2692198 RepID=UPI00136AC720|nr:hypothetical protein [Streptomyces sp. HUCO-GS316]MXM66783.1 hypothetical protein [Streptomyces sp. HUCO-GS316]